MPIPSKRKKEDKNKFMSRCMSDEVMKKEYPDNSQRVAICMSKAMEGLSMIEASDMEYYIKTYGYTEDVTEDNFYVPSEAEYVDFEEKTEEWDCAVEKPGLWENIRKKKEREGKKYKPAKPGDKDRPDPEAWKKAQSRFKYKSVKTGEIYFFERRSKYKKDGEILQYLGETKALEYQGRKVTLNKPFRTPDGPKKFSVYVKNDKGNVVKVNFGDPNMEIKRDIPERRKSFRARHHCDTNPGPKWKARYWSCKMW